MGVTRSARQQPDSGERPQRRWMQSEVGLVMVDSALRPIAFNSEAAAILSYPERPTTGQEATVRVPEEVIESIRGRSPADVSSVVSYFRAGKRKYTCQAYPMVSRNEHLSGPITALLLQRNTSTVEAVYEVAAQYNLTGREREALEGISAGLTSKELAKHMNISPNTVKAYLRIIMVKMNVNSRAAMVAKILEQNASGQGKLISADNGRRALRTGV